MGLPKFEGRNVSGARSKFNGFSLITDNALRSGATVWMLVEAKVQDVHHPEDAKGVLTREHTLVIKRQCEYPDEKQAKELLDIEQAAREERERQAQGQEVLGDEVSAKRTAKRTEDE